MQKINKNEKIQRLLDLFKSNHPYVAEKIMFGKLNQKNQKSGTFFIEENFRITGIAYYEEDELLEEGRINF